MVGSTLSMEGLGVMLMVVLRIQQEHHSRMHYTISFGLAKQKRNPGRDAFREVDRVWGTCCAAGA